MFTKNPFNKKDEVADLIGNILEADYKVKKEELKGNQHKIDMNKNNKIDAHDFKLLRSKGASQKDEEIDPNKVTTDTLRGRTPGKSANPFLSQKAFMDVPDNVKEEAKGVTEGSEQDDDYSNASFERWKQQKAYEKEYDKKKPAKPIVPDNKDKKRGVAEEVEQIDELSSSTIDSYRKKLGAKIDTTRTTRPSLKAAIQAKNAPIQAKIHNALMKQHQAIRRERGMSEEVELDEEHLLVAKSDLKKHKDWMDSEGYDTKTKPLPVNHPKHKTHVEIKPNSPVEHSYHLDGYAVKEEVEQLDEIGDTPAGKRALRAVQTRAADTMSDPSKSSKQVNKAVGAGVSAGNRLHGFGHDRMKKNTVMGRDALRKQLGVKEEVEQIDERELTKGETKEKERIVKGMKKSLSGFKKRYGDRAKSVMYATATKAAKKD